MVELRRRPWTHLVIDDFLPREILHQSMDEVRAHSYEFEIENRGAGRIEYSLLHSQQMCRAIYSKRTIDILQDAFDLEIALNRDNFVQLRRMNEETPEFPIHNDYVEGANTIASFLYLSSDWSEDRGGRFNLFESEEQRVPSLRIDPLQNRLLAFRTDRAHWHSVEKVQGWKRFSILALWDIQS